MKLVVHLWIKGLRCAQYRTYGKFGQQFDEDRPGNIMTWIASVQDNQQFESFKNAACFVPVQSVLWKFSGLA